MPGPATVAGEVDERGLPARAYAAALAGLPGMGPARLSSVLGAVSPAEAWACVQRGQTWRQPAVVAALGPQGAAVVAGWQAAARTIDVAAGWQRVVESDVGVTLPSDTAYPSVLAADIEPPAVAFHVGRLDVVDGDPGSAGATRRRVAIVGTRRCTTIGMGVAFELGRDLAAEGVSVVSGLADGIDSAAHRGALDAGAAPPVGVVGCGLDVVYPTSQRKLWHAVADAGLLLSEAPLGARPERWRFPARNRIIAALAEVVIVVESHRTGGSFHTVDEADRRGIDVMVVPGSVRSAAAAGTNDLLAEGRMPVRDAGDVMMALGLSTAGPRRSTAQRPELSAGDKAVLDAVGWQPSSLDQLALRTGLVLPSLAAALDRLCVAGWVALDGGWYVRIAPEAR